MDTSKESNTLRLQMHQTQEILSTWKMKQNNLLTAYFTLYFGSMHWILITHSLIMVGLLQYLVVIKLDLLLCTSGNMAQEILLEQLTNLSLLMELHALIKEKNFLWSILNPTPNLVLSWTQSLDPTLLNFGSNLLLR